MKALLVAATDTGALPLIELIRRHPIDVEFVRPAEVTPPFASNGVLFVLFPLLDGSDLEALVNACWRLRSSPDRVPLVLAVAHDIRQVNALVDAGADDFLLWPAEAELLSRRLEVCRARVVRREREVIRAQLMVEAVRDAERSEQRFRHLADSSTEILTRCSPGGVRLYVSPACRAVLGYEPDELLGSSMLDSLHPADASKFVETLEWLERGADTAAAIIRLQRKGGDFAWLEMNCQPLRDPETDAIEEIVTVARDITALMHMDHDPPTDEGRLGELVGTGRDIAERRTLEQELADASNFLRDVIDAVPDPISVQDDDGKYVMVNRSFAELVGHPREQIVGCAVASIRPAADGRDSESWPEVSDEREITWPATDGLLRSLSEKRAVLADRKGHHVLVSVMRDVTERKRYETQLALTERLASLGTLAAGIAHEINNPLSYVIGNLAFATNALGPDPTSSEGRAQLPELRSALSDALEGARRIGNIVRDVKTFSRADRDTLKLVEPTGVIDASLRMVQSNIESRARVIREICDVPRVLGNEARLTQVMVNLLLNAVQAFPERPPSENQITVGVRSDQRSIVMEVRDNGQGMPPDTLRHVFDPFFTTKPIGEGMGLGLSICNSIVAAHGGCIDVDSTVGVGTAFRVIIPAASHIVKRPA